MTDFARMFGLGTQRWRALLEVSLMEFSKSAIVPAGSLQAIESGARLPQTWEMAGIGWAIGCAERAVVMGPGYIGCFSPADLTAPDDLALIAHQQAA